MSTWKDGVYTTQGLTLLSKLTQGISLNITKITYGTGVVADTDLSNQTTVSGEQGELTAQTPSYPAIGECKLPLFLSNENITSEVTVRQIGLYAYDPDVGEILYFIAQSTTGTNIPTASVAPGFTATWTFKFKYGTADTINITVDPSNAVTPDMLNEVYIKMAEGASVRDSGYPITLEKTANLPIPALSLYGKSWQETVPSPTDNAPIHSLLDSGDIQVKVCGKNLIEYSSKQKTTAGITYTVNNDGSITINGTSTSNAYFIFDEANFIMNKDVDLIASLGSNRTDVHMVIGCFKSNGEVVNSIASVANGEVRFKYPTIASTTRTFIGVDSGVTFNNFTVYPMIRVADTISDYECPEYQKITVNAPKGLKGIPVNSGGNYTDESGQQWICDELDLVNGMYIQRVNSVDLGTLTWTYIVDYSVFTANLEDIKLDTLNLICTHYETSNIIGANSPDMTIYGRKTGTIGSVGVKDSHYTDATIFTNNVSGAILVYQLATPIETPLTPAEIEACKVLHSNNPTTTVINSVAAEMSVECVGSNYENVVNMIMTNCDVTEPLNDFQKSMQIVRPNLLDNPRFKVNQQGLSSYTSDTLPVYCIDRWLLYNTSLTINSDSITLTKSGNSGTGINCKIKKDGVNINEKITISILLSNGELISNTGMIQNNLAATFSTGYITISLQNEYISFIIFVNSNTNTEIKAVKLEVGEGQTLAYQDSNGNWVLYDDYDYNEDLINCTVNHYNIEGYHLGDEFAYNVGAIQPRPNLLDNPRFKVNQRGMDSYTGITYGLDRWKDRFNGLILVGDDCVYLSKKDDNNYQTSITQILTNELVEKINNETITLSIIINNELYSKIIHNFDINGNNLFKLFDNNIELVIGKLNNSINLVQIYRAFTNNTENVKITAVKLEIGEGQTLAYQDSNGNWVLYDDYDYERDLLECQKYLRVFYNYNTIVCNKNYGAFVIDFPLNIKMIDLPTVTFSTTSAADKKCDLQLINNSIKFNITSLTCEGIDNNTASVYVVTDDNTESSDIVGYLVTAMDKTSKFILSAEL